MESDEEFKLTAKKLKELGQKQLTKEERKKRQRALNSLGIPTFLGFYKKQQKEHGIGGTFLVTLKYCSSIMC